MRATSAFRTACAVAVALAAGGGACNHTASREGSGDGASSAAGAPDMSRVLARVGDRTITLGDYVAALDHMDQFDRLRYQAPERRKALLDEMIDVMLLADEARERGYDHDPEAEQSVREILRDAVLAQARAGAPAPSAIPEADVRSYFDAHHADFHDPERRRVSAIVLATKSAAESALAAALDADGGLAWGELVRARSTDRRAKSPDVPVDLAGDLGFVAPPGDPRGDDPAVPEPVRAAVFEAKRVGDVVPHVVAAGGAFYVVRFQSKSDPRDRTFEDAERTIRVKLAQDAARAKEDALVATLRKETPVTIDEAALARVRVDLDGGAPPPKGTP